MYIYVWRSNQTLKNYGGGKIVVAANTIEEAWQKLKIANADAFYYCQYGHRYFTHDFPPEKADDPEDLVPRLGFPDVPEEFSLEKFPVIVQWGSD